MEKPDTMSVDPTESLLPSVSPAPSPSPSPASSLHYRAKYDSLNEQFEASRRLLALAEEKNRGYSQELTHLLALAKSKLLKTDDERNEFASYAQERIALRAEIDALRVRVREDTEICAALRTDASAARAQLAERDRRTEEKERSVNRLRAALTNFEHRSSKTNLLDFDNDLAQARVQLAAKRKKHKDAKITILKHERNMIDINQNSNFKDKKIEMLQDDLQKVRQELEDLHKKLRSEISNSAILSQENISIVSELEKFRRINKELKNTADDQQREILVLRAENSLLQDVQGGSHLPLLESELAKELDSLRALQNEELNLGDSVGESSITLHTSERAIHLQLEIDKLNVELEQAQKLTKQSQSLQSKLKEAKKKNKTMKDDFTERRKHIELTKEKSESHLVVVKDEPPKTQTRTNSNSSLPEGVKQEGIEQLKESQKVITDTLQKVRIRTEKSNLEQHIEQLLGNLPPIPEEKKMDKIKSVQETKQETEPRIEETHSKEENTEEINGKEPHVEVIVEKQENELKLKKGPLVRIGTLERTLSATKLRLERSSSSLNLLLDANEVPDDWKEREKALNAQFERLKKVVFDSEKQKATEANGTGIGAKSPAMDLSDSTLLLKPSKVKSVEKLQRRIQERQDKLKQMGVAEMGLQAALVEESETKLTESEEELILQIPYAQEDDDSIIDKLVRTLAEKYKRAREANRARILSEISQLVKDINSNLSHKLTRKDVDTDLEENIHVVNECKKLNFKLVSELESLQIIAQQESKGKIVKTGWWKGWGTGEENVSDVDAAAKFLIRESQRLYDLRDNYVAVCNKVASLSESLHQCEKDIFKWRLGLEDVYDRVTARMEGGSWGPGLSEKLLVCRRLLISHLSARSSLEAARTQRATMRLLVENFSEGLYVVFAAETGLETLGSKVVSELTKIRQAERKVILHREELLDDSPLQEISAKKRVARIAHGGLAGVSLVSTMILHSPRLFSRFHPNEVPEIIRKSIGYLEERAMDDQGLLLRTYELPKITQIKKFFESGSYDVDLSDCADHRVISELLKSHLRDMKAPLFTFDLYRDWMKVDQIESGDDQLTCIRGLIEKLPSENFSCLAVIMHFLHKVANNFSVNKCSTRLLARVFAPLILRSKR